MHARFRCTGRPARPVEGIPEWIVIPDTANAWGACSAEVRELAAARYAVQHVIKAMDLEGNLFDQQDALFYPFAGFKNAQEFRLRFERELADFIRTGASPAVP